ncbi:porin family protein [Aliivibrio finisterrensis]|uniref:Porin family protein n=2 Tax=Vibrionaceae TaxID=641 RepID=A0A4Q5KWL0_9GAMM|nr:porin family protein [Aliivibrio finisterrensis]RYU51606.1 porin family protein [Aliivibrio finisterrensis]RYU52831.1 porin family protein [Aliivibrio finisterrensis]RYU58329.1 porin family protein [Aliivibrio finisterrensis]RYU64112.1 porin family protein [Aliivibrio finisterrensis]RYU83447.1 porin family protein [Aliivibrio finisterrensis]
MKRTSLLGLLAILPLQIFAQVYLTPSIGFSSGGEVTNSAGDTYKINGDNALSFAIETDFDTGRIGLFYSTQSSEVKSLGNKTRFDYLHFQSALDYSLTPKLSSFLGLSLGATYTDVDWSDENLRFSAGAFTGLQYHFTDNFALQLEARWLGTSVDSSFDSACVSDSTQSRCVIRYEGSWMNQVQGNLGLRFSF